uniref:Prostate transmembrane protein, androgen induced 1 n=1 Tax=Oryctolagus cuniculus TaxID=9986 RepID=A0A5F9CNE8_RABIT
LPVAGGSAGTAAASCRGTGPLGQHNPPGSAQRCARVSRVPLPTAELEFVQILIIVVVMMVVVVVITCLLNHYRLSPHSLISRHSQARRRGDTLASEGCLWPSESTVSGGGIPEVYAPARPADRLAVPPFEQRGRFHRFQPTYPYLQHDIDLPPTISLSDGEEPPPYQGPCTLQLRDPEQQLELNRSRARAPEQNVFDSDLMDSAWQRSGACPAGRGRCRALARWRGLTSSLSVPLRICPHTRSRHAEDPNERRSCLVQLRCCLLRGDGHSGGVGGFVFPWRFGFWFCS